MLLNLLCLVGSLHVLPADWMHKYADAMHDFGITVSYYSMQVTC